MSVNRATCFVLLWFCKTLASEVQLTTNYTRVYESQMVELNCSLDVVPVDKAAEFLLRGSTLTNIRFHNNKCYNTFTGQICSAHQCGCSIDGRSYTTTYRSTEPGNETFSCKMVFNNNRVSVSNEVTVSVFESPTLLMRDQVYCNRSVTATFICTVKDSTGDLQFQSWKHTFNGTFIRFLKGTNDGRISVLPLRSCNIQDAGEYHCTVSTYLSGEARITTTTSKLFTAESPKILNMTTYCRDKKVEFEVIFYSSSFVQSVEWFNNNMSLHNDSTIYKAIKEHNVQMNVHDIVISVNGHICLLIIEEMYYTNGQYRVCITNQYGASCYNFRSRKKGDISSFNVFWVMIAVVLFTLTVGFVVMLTLLVVPKQVKTEADIPRGMSTEESRIPPATEANELRYTDSAELELHTHETSSPPYCEILPHEPTTVNNEVVDPYLDIIPDEDTLSKQSDDYETVY